MENQPDSGKNEIFYYYHIVFVLLSSCFILILAFVGITYKVYKNYCSMLMIAVMVFEGIDLLTMSCLHLCGFFDTIEGDYKGHYIQSILNAFFSTFINALLIL